MPLKFAANISTLFTEYPFESRFKEAKNCGFNAVEFQDGYMLSPNALNNAALDSKVNVVLVNSHPGNQGDFGLAALPGRELDFSFFLSKTLEYLSALDCKKVHILAGFKSQDFTEEEQLVTYVKNLQIASAMLEEHSAIGVIEPICHEVKNNYFLSSFDLAVDVIKRVEKSNIKLLLDIYHMHKITQQVKGNLEKFYPYAGHIQISQDPGRTQPFQPGGKIDYQEVFDFLQFKDHQDFIGLEYFPTGSTTNSIEWVKMYL